MLETILYFSAFNAFTMKVMSKNGLIYADSKYFKEWLLEMFFGKTPPKGLLKFLRCVPCRMFWFFGIPQSVLFYMVYGYQYQVLFAPLLIAVLSSFFYVIINPNHEEN